MLVAKCSPTQVDYGSSKMPPTALNRAGVPLSVKSTDGAAAEGTPLPGETPAQGERTAQYSTTNDSVQHAPVSPNDSLREVPPKTGPWQDLNDTPWTSECQGPSTTQQERRQSARLRNKEIEHRTRTESPPALRPTTAPTDGPHTPLTQEYVVDSLVSHGRAEDGELLFRVRWYGCGVNGDTWEPIEHLSASKVVQYVRGKRIELPATVGRALVG